MSSLSTSLSTTHSTHLSSTALLAQKNEAIEEFDYPFCDDVSKYEKLTKIGQGLHQFI
jgi:cyclin-dependent kinase 9